jgi:hypothetical protein
MAGVEFLSDDGESESQHPAASHLPSEPALDDSPMRRVARSRLAQSWVTRGIVVALAIGAVATWVVTRPPSGTRPVVTVTVPAAAGPQIPEHLPPEHVSLVCQLGAPVATEIANAMKRFLRPIAIANLDAYRCLQGVGPARRIVSETVFGRRHNLVIHVDVSSTGLDIVPNISAVRADGRSKVLLGSAESDAAGLTVRVSAIGPVGTTAPLRKLVGLADFLSLNIVL